MTQREPEQEPGLGQTTLWVGLAPTRPGSAVTNAPAPEDEVSHSARELGQALCLPAAQHRELQRLLHQRPGLQPLLVALAPTIDELQLGPAALTLRCASPGGSASEAALRRSAVLLAHQLQGLLPGSADTALLDLSRLAGLAHLRSLQLCGDRLAQLEQLVRALRAAPGYALGALTLQNLELEDPDLSPLERLWGLASLRLEGMAAPLDLEQLGQLVQLGALSLRQSPVQQLSGLHTLLGLHTLSLNYTRVADLTPLQPLQQLERLYLRHTAVCDLRPLAALPRLRQLNLRQSRVCEVTPLGGLQQLELINLRETAVEDIEPLRRLTGLRQLLTRGSRVPEQTLRELAADRPELELDLP